MMMTSQCVYVCVYVLPCFNLLAHKHKMRVLNKGVWINPIENKCGTQVGGTVVIIFIGGGFGGWK